MTPLVGNRGIISLARAIVTVDVFTNKKNVEPLLCSHNVSPNEMELSCNINPLGSQHVDEEVCGWGR